MVYIHAVISATLLWLAGPDLTFSSYTCINLHGGEGGGGVAGGAEPPRFKAPVTMSDFFQVHV